MNGLHYAWELFKLTLGVILILATAIYTIVRFLDSVMHIEAYQPNLCGAEAWIGVDTWATCDRPAGHDGYHHDDTTNLDWSDAPATAEVAP